MAKLKILVLEDHLLAQQVLTMNLKSLGDHDISIAQNSNEAVKFLSQETTFDILIFNVLQPYADEIDFLRDAAEKNAVNAILLSYDANAVLQQALRNLAKLHGFQVLGELHRPFSKEELQAALSRYTQKNNTPTMLLAEIPSSYDIAKAAKNGEFVPYFQPKVDLQTMNIVGAEVLARWNHPELGVLSPATFIDVARHFNQLNDMTISIMRQAFSFANRHSIMSNLKLAINFDASHLRQPNMHRLVRNLIEKEHIPAKNLIIEITETDVLESPVICIENLIRLRMLGCSVSIDDFGAGLSSLQRICELPCDEIKLDTSFTKNITSNYRSLAAIESISTFSRKIGTQLVAEGIETQEQVDLLKSANCQIGQGYYFSPPVPGEKFISLLTHRISGAKYNAINSRI